MAVYTIHQPPQRSGEAEPDQFKLVRDGFHVSAFLFGPLWMAAHRLWLALLGYLVVMTAISVTLHQIDADGGARFMILLAIALLIGFEAPSLQRAKLSRKGWKNIGLVSANDLEEAERRFFARWVQDAPQSVQNAPAQLQQVQQAAGWTARSYFAQKNESGVVGLFPEPGRTR